MNALEGIYWFSLVVILARTIKEFLTEKESYAWYYYLIAIAMAITPVNCVLLFWIFLYYEILGKNENKKEILPTEEGSEEVANPQGLVA